MSFREYLEEAGTYKKRDVFANYDGSPMYDIGTKIEDKQGNVGTITKFKGDDAVIKWDSGKTSTVKNIIDYKAV